MKNLTIIIISILLFIAAGSLFYNIKLLKITKDYQAKEQSKQRQYEACLEKCDSIFSYTPNTIFTQPCKLECKENYGI